MRSIIVTGQDPFANPAPEIKTSKDSSGNLFLRVWVCVKVFFHCISCGIFTSKPEKNPLPPISYPAHSPLKPLPLPKKIEATQPLKSDEADCETVPVRHYVDNYEKNIDTLIESGALEKAEIEIKKWAIFSGKNGYHSNRTDHQFYERLITGYLQKNTLDATANAYRVAIELMPTTYPQKDTCYEQVLIACLAEGENFEARRLYSLITDSALKEKYLQHL